MKIYIGLLPQPEFRDIYEEHVEGLAARFDLVKLRERKRMPHVTLKQPFETEDISGIEELVKGIATDQGPLQLELDSYGRFDNRILYFSVAPHKEALGLRKKLQGELSKKGINPVKYDKGELHISLAKDMELEDKFQEVGNYLSTQSFELPVTLKNIAIFRKEEDGSKIYRTYKLKG